MNCAVFYRCDFKVVASCIDVILRLNVTESGVTSEQLYPYVGDSIFNHFHTLCELASFPRPLLTFSVTVIRTEQILELTTEVIKNENLSKSVYSS